MFNPTHWIKTTLTAAVPWLRVSEGDAESHAVSHVAKMVPIRSLGPGHRERIRTHLLALSPADRYLRFGYHAHDEQISRYVDSLNFERDEIYGIYNRRLTLLAVAHLVLPTSDAPKDTAEFGVSVLAKARGRGFGARMFERAAMHARNAGVPTIYIQALSENAPMIAIARKAGAEISREGGESECYVRLPPPSFDSRITEMVQEQIAQTDYQFKVQTKPLIDLFVAHPPAEEPLVKDAEA